MILDYKTGKLPPNFIFLGAFLLIIGIWRIIVLDWVGIILLVISLLFLFVKSGVLIDTSNKKIESYSGVFSIKIGDWEDIRSLKHLLVVKAKETQSMNVLSINRTESKIVYKLMMVLANKKIELMSGDKNFIIKTAKEISEKLQTTVLS